MMVRWSGERQVTKANLSLTLLDVKLVLIKFFIKTELYLILSISKLDLDTYYIGLNKTE